MILSFMGRFKRYTTIKELYIIVNLRHTDSLEFSVISLVFSHHTYSDVFLILLSSIQVDDCFGNTISIGNKKQMVVIHSL